MRGHIGNKKVVKYSQFSTHTKHIIPPTMSSTDTNLPPESYWVNLVDTDQGSVQVHVHWTFWKFNENTNTFKVSLTWLPVTHDREVVKECAKHAREEDIDAKVRRSLQMMVLTSFRLQLLSHGDCADNTSNQFPCFSKFKYQIIIGQKIMVMVAK